MIKIYTDWEQKQLDILEEICNISDPVECNKQFEAWLNNGKTN